MQPLPACLNGQPALAVFDVWVGARHRQPLCHIQPALARSQVQRRVAVAVLHVAVCPRTQQRVHHCHVAACSSKNGQQE
jgi:hypothetical protein